MRVEIYDPNNLNPYGLELAVLLAKFGRYIRFWTPASRVDAQLDGVQVIPLLADRVQQGRLKAAILRILSPLRLVLSTPRRVPLIAVWLKDPWDMFVLLVRVLAGGRVLVVYHNPRQPDSAAYEYWLHEPAL